MAKAFTIRCKNDPQGNLLFEIQTDDGSDTSVYIFTQKGAAEGYKQVVGPLTPTTFFRTYGDLGAGAFVGVIRLVYPTDHADGNKFFLKHFDVITVPMVLNIDAGRDIARDDDTPIDGRLDYRTVYGSASSDDGNDQPYYAPTGSNDSDD
jgi:hypothetical protein